MSLVATDQILESLGWRYATKQFDSTRKITEQDWGLLAETIRLAPSSYGLQPWRALVIQNPQTRKALRSVSWDQSQVEDCSHYVVFAALKKVTEEYIGKFIETVAQQRGLAVDALAQYREMMVGDLVKGPRAEISQFWSQRQVYIAMGMLLETAALRRIDTCPLEGLDPTAYDKILALEGGEYATVAAVALGYRSAADGYQKLKKVRFSLDCLVELRK